MALCFRKKHAAKCFLNDCLQNSFPHHAAASLCPKPALLIASNFGHDLMLIDFLGLRRCLCRTPRDQFNLADTNTSTTCQTDPKREAKQWNDTKKNIAGDALGRGCSEQAHIDAISLPDGHTNSSTRQSSTVMPCDATKMKNHTQRLRPRHGMSAVHMQHHATALEQRTETVKELVPSARAVRLNSTSSLSVCRASSQDIGSTFSLHRPKQVGAEYER